MGRVGVRCAEKGDGSKIILVECVHDVCTREYMHTLVSDCILRTEAVRVLSAKNRGIGDRLKWAMTLNTR